ncbi:MAG TPA: WS/DGAT domain-containing protein [Marmoricola sp.]|nr:WS/DGAT domain-containing protein [Marmoricola sp.]
MSSSTTEIAAQDQLWLHMDRPNNLMIVRALMWLDHEPDWDLVHELLQERLIDRYPVFSQIPVERNGRWHWVPDPEFALDRHLTHRQLDGADQPQLRDLISSEFSEPLPRDQPLWSIQVIHGVRDEDGVARPVLFSSFHHSLADGIRLVQVTLGLCDSVVGATPTLVGRGQDSQGGGLAGTAIAALRRGFSDGVDFGLGLARAGISFPIQVFANALSPRSLIDLVESVASQENTLVNTGSELVRLLTATQATTTSWSGKPGPAKRVAWASDLPLEPLKAAAIRHNGTVNDAMLAIVSRALSAYLAEHQALVPGIQWLVPVSIQPLDADLPKDLGNHFALVFLEMPLGIEKPDALFAALQERMLRIKHSAVPVLTTGLQWMVAESPKQIAVALTNFFANKGAGVLTNVPGPRAEISFAGVTVTRMLGWAPASGDQPLCLCIYSYNDSICIGISADAELVPDPERIAELVQAAYDELTAAPC